MTDHVRDPHAPADPASPEFALADHGGWPGLLTELLDGRDLTADQSRAAMHTILSGHATAAQLIGFVVALRAKGETADEMSGMLDAVLDHAALVELDEPTPLRRRRHRRDRR